MSLAQQLARLGELFGGNQNASGLPLSNRNYIVDGNFESVINTSQTLTLGVINKSVMTMFYGYIGNGSTGAGTFSSNAGGGVASGATLEPVGMTSPVRGGAALTVSTASNGTVAASTAPGIWQDVEDVRTLNARSATLSMWLWCGSGTLNITNVIARQIFGTGGSPSSSVVVDTAVNWTVTTTPQRFSVRVDLPSTHASTLGTNNDHYLQIGVWLPVGSTYIVATAQWQLEQSSANAPAAGMPTTFEYRGQQAEAARAARYYQGVAASLTTYTTAGNGIGYLIDYPVAMRGTPGVAISNQSYVNASAMTATSPSTNSVQTGATTTATGPSSYTGVITLDARL